MQFHPDGTADAAVFVLSVRLPEGSEQEELQGWVVLNAVSGMAQVKKPPTPEQFEGMLQAQAALPDLQLAEKAIEVSETDASGTADLLGSAASPKTASPTSSPPWAPMVPAADALRGATGGGTGTASAAGTVQPLVATVPAATGSALRQADMLGVAPVNWQSRNHPTGHCLRHFVSGLFDNTYDVPPRRKWKKRFLRMNTLPHQQVCEGHAGSEHAYPHIALSRLQAPLPPRSPRPLGPPRRRTMIRRDFMTGLSDKPPRGSEPNGTMRARDIRCVAPDQTTQAVTLATRRSDDDFVVPSSPF